MKKTLLGLMLSCFVGVASAMPSYQVTPPVPTQHVHVHYNHFDRNSYIIGGAMIGVTAVMLIWVLTDRYVDPTHYSVQF